jgi:hypothetical protein
MPINKENFDLKSGVIEQAKNNIASFLSEDEFSKVKITVVDGNLSIDEPKETLAKISESLKQQ